MNVLTWFPLSFAILLAIIIQSGAALNGSKSDSKIHHVKPFYSENQTIKRENFKQPEMVQNIKNSEPAHLTNKQILSKLGLTKLRVPSSHSRKRLAVESRHHVRPDDSHMFVIKLPPNGIYYTNTKVADSKNSIADNGKRVSSFNFRSNGKPGRIYHWNIPVLKKILSDDSRAQFMLKHHDVSDLLDIKTIPTWPKPWENETIEKAYGKITAAENKSLKKKSPSYYAPISHKKNNNFHKYFPGNGKPKGFYVIKKSQKPAYYKELIP